MFTFLPMFQESCPIHLPLLQQDQWAGLTHLAGLVYAHSVHVQPAFVCHLFFCFVQGRVYNNMNRASQLFRQLLEVLESSDFVALVHLLLVIREWQNWATGATLSHVLQEMKNSKTPVALGPTLEIHVDCFSSSVCSCDTFPLTSQL